MDFLMDLKINTIMVIDQMEFMYPDFGTSRTSILILFVVMVSKVGGGE